MNFSKHYKESVRINAKPEEIFAYNDEHANFSSHMNKSSWMMGGGKMETSVDEGKGRKIGSHIKMKGNIFGIDLSLDEVITIHNPPYLKEWQTVGKINLLVIDHYKLGFEIASEQHKSRLRVYIEYNLPKSAKTKFLGYLLSGFYAKWCVHQMIKDTKDHFGKTSGFPR